MFRLTLLAAALVACSAPPAVTTPDAGAPSCPGVDLANDAKNCGICGHACESPLHAAAACVKGSCARGPCDDGYFDFDGATTLGCEARCVGRHCTLGDGTTVDVSSAPLPERGLTASALASGSSFGAAVQTSASRTNIAVLGDSTPIANGHPVQESAHHRHEGGFTSHESP